MDLFEILKEHWQVFLIIGSAICYTIGYLKAIFFLNKLRVYATPTEVYSPMSLLVSGIATLTAGITVPLVLVSCSLLTCKANIHVNLNTGLLMLAGIALGMFSILPLMAKLNPPGFKIFPHHYFPPYRSILRYITAVVLAALVFSCLFACVIDQMTEYATTLRGASVLLWIVVLTWSHYDTASDVSAGASPGLLSQDPAMLGNLITYRRISDRGAETSGFGDRAFKTGGILLNLRSGHFYFLPGTYAQEQMESESQCGMVIVPESQVITFWQDPGTDTR